MPISRSNTVRNKSRSPVPPPLVSNPYPSATRDYLPGSQPSQGAGVGFNSRSPIIRTGSSSIHGESIEHRKLNQNNSSRQVSSKRKDVWYNTSNHQDDVAMPAMCGPPRANSDTDSLDHASRAFSRLPLPIPLSSTLSRRSSCSRTGFPELEAQLLPSLRDTIDRMTKTSSRVSVVNPNPHSTEAAKRGGHSHDHGHGHGHGYSSPRIHGFEYRTTTTAAGASGPSQSKLQLSSSYPGQERYNEDNVSNIYPNSNHTTAHTPTIGSSTSFRLKQKQKPKPKAKPNPPAKSALKSSFRSPTPTPSPIPNPTLIPTLTTTSIPTSTPTPNIITSPPPPPPPPPVNPPSATGASLRSMKSLLSRKCSGTLRSPFAGTKSSTSSSSSAMEGNCKGASASTPTPTSLGIDYHYQLLATPGAEPGYTSSATKHSFHSNIPIPRSHMNTNTNTKSQHQHWDDPISSEPQNYMEDSDLDRRYDSELRDRRKLTVANAEVPMSLSSESDAESRRRFEFDLACKVGGGGGDRGGGWANDTRNLKAYESRSPVGLGLSLRQHTTFKERSSPSPSSSTTPTPNPHHRQRNSKSRSPENPQVQPIQQEKSLRFSLPASESAGSSYSDEFVDYRTAEACTSRRYSGSDGVSADFDFARRRGRFHFEDRQMAGVGAGAGVGVGAKYHKQQSQLQRQRSSPNSAICDATTDEDTESEREGYSFQRKRRSKENLGGGGRSAGHDRTYSAVSEQDRYEYQHQHQHQEQEQEQESDGFVPVVSPRSRSAGTRRESPSPRASASGGGFSPTIRELIKSRHSFSRPFLETKVSPTLNSPGKKPRQWNMEYGEAYSEASTPRKSTQSSPHFDSNRHYNSHHHRHHHREQYMDEKEPQGQGHGRTAASAIAEDYRSAAARERMAFGIPPSESDQATSALDCDDQPLSSGESNMSSINASLWQDDSEGLSEEAESVFQSLRHSTKRRPERDSGGQDTLYDRTPRLSVVSPTLSGSSTCDVHPPKGHIEPQAGGADVQGTSKSREGVIQEIFETEEDLIHHYHICMNMFVLPLRVHNSRSWIAGVPPNIARLLDWFDDIVNLHEQIYDSLCSARDTMSPATDRVSESLRCFVFKVEVYQPYLVRLADVSEEIARLVDDPKSDFGQFVTIQQRYPECEGWSFERLLMLPVNRLAAYQDLFARLLDLTPKTHQDYLSTFSLSRSTDMVIKIMTEVKIREDEYNLLKTFSSRIQGLPPSNGLASRERRLLHSGPLALIISGLSETSKQPWDPNYQLQASESRRADRSSRLLDAISTSTSVFGRSESEKSASSFDTGDSSGKGPVATTTPVKSSWFSRLPLGKRARSKSPLPAIPTSQATESQDHVEIPSLSCLKTVPVHAFVFSDLVLLAQPGQTRGDKPHWILSSDLGVFRPLSIARIQDMKQEGTVLSLEALVSNTDNFNDNIDFGTASFLTVDLLLPQNNVPPAGSIEVSVVDELFGPWILSFRQCAKTTLRKLTFLGLGTQQHPSCSSDRTLDTFLAVSSLVGSGLPLPRSPSGQFPDQFKDGTDELSGDEREERGWWSLRYQQVFREYQRQDSLLSDEDDAL